MVGGEVHDDADTVLMSGGDHVVERSPGTGNKGVAEMLLDALHVARPIAVIGRTRRIAGGCGAHIDVIHWR